MQSEKGDATSEGDGADSTRSGGSDTTVTTNTNPVGSTGTNGNSATEGGSRRKLKPVSAMARGVQFCVLAADAVFLPSLETEEVNALKVVRRRIRAHEYDFFTQQRRG